MYKIGMSCCGFALTEENFKKLKQAGIAAIEIAMPLQQHLELDYAEVHRLSQKYDILLWSYHFPFSPFSEIDVSSCDAKVRENTVELYTKLIKNATAIGVDKFVVHPSGEPIPDEERQARIQYSMETLDKLAKIAADYGAVIAVEDLPRTCLGNTADEMLRLISVNENLRVCFDTNHLLVDTNLNFMEKLGDKIVTLHVSDYDFTNEKHWLPGEGKVDWKSIMAMLQKIDYRGVFMYELSLVPPKTLSRSRDLTFEDFACNAKALFAGEEFARVY